MEVPFPYLDLDLCVDGSPYYLNSDQVTGYSVTPENKVRMDCINKDLPAVQRKDCKYTDSRYAFGVCHATGQFWKGRGFITSRESKY